MHYHVVYWTGYCDCVHHGFKWVLKPLRTYVYFTRLQEEKYFCSNKMFTSRKLTGDEILFSFSSLLQLNDTTNICTANIGHSDHYRLLHFTFQHRHTPTHTHTHVYMFSGIFTGILEKLPVSANWSCSKQVPNQSFLSDCQIVQFVILDDSNEYSYHYLTS
jgi:hypothetical protein